MKGFLYNSDYQFTTLTANSGNILSNCNAITFFAPPAGFSPYRISNGPILAPGDPPITLSAASAEEIITTTFICNATTVATVQIPYVRKLIRRNYDIPSLLDKILKFVSK